MTPVASNITTRQIQILTLMRDGATAKQAAGALNISEFTVRTMLADALDRLGALNTTQAVIIACRCGYITIRKDG